jgi:hypothetical protein
MSAVYESVPIDLDPTSTDIRLLEIVHEATHDKDSLILCRLRTVPLRALPRNRYTALSYVWGPPIPTREILLNDKPFTIRENLWTFLQQARQSQERSLFCIDAICINQSDTAERTHQVSVMGRTYSCAALVVVWLGFSPEDTLRTENAISALISQFQFEEVGFGQWLAQHHQQILILCSHDYWGRTWVIQEYVLAQNVMLWVGRQGGGNRWLGSLFDHIARHLEKQEQRRKSLVEYLGQSYEWTIKQGIAQECMTIRALLDSPAARLSGRRTKWHVESAIAKEEPPEISMFMLVTTFGHTLCADPDIMYTRYFRYAMSL